MKVKYNFLFLVVILLFACSCIKTQQDIMMEEELKKIKTNQEKVKKNIHTQDINYRKKELQKNQMISDVQAEIQLLSGKIDEYNFKNEKQLNEKYSELSKQLSLLQKQIDELKVEIDALKKVKVGQGIDPERQKLSEKALYNRAYKEYTKKKYSLSLLDFKALLQRFPKTKYKENALFFKAEALFNLEQHEEAILSYEDILKNFPKTRHKITINLKQGLCFVALGASDDAKYFLNQVIKLSPKSSQAKTAKKALRKLSSRKKK